MNRSPYLRLMAMAVLSFLSMYGLMYSMVNEFANVYPNHNQFYMAGLMTAPMMVFELVLMGVMYPNRRLNAGVIGLSVIVAIGLFASIRQQAVIGDRQFLKSMIPHHAGAILMCQRASIADPDVQDLCQSIVASQQSEIDQMKEILARFAADSKLE